MSGRVEVRQNCLHHQGGHARVALLLERTALFSQLRGQDCLIHNWEISGYRADAVAFSREQNGLHTRLRRTAISKSLTDGRKILNVI